MRPTVERVADHDGDGIRLRIKQTLDDELTTISAYSTAKEILGLSGPGPQENDGVRVITEVPRYRDGEGPEDDDAYPVGYTIAVWEFDDEQTLQRACERLFEKGEEMVDWDAAGSPEVYELAGALTPPV